MSMPESEDHARLRRIAQAARACDEADRYFEEAKEELALARKAVKQADAAFRRLVYAETAEYPLLVSRPRDPHTPAAEDDSDGEDDEEDLVNQVAWEGSEPPNFDDWCDDLYCWELGPGGNGV